MELIVAGLVATLASFLTFLAARQWQGDRYLCGTCRFNNAESCHKVERPTAVICVSYRRQ